MVVVCCCTVVGCGSCSRSSKTNHFAVLVQIYVKLFVSWSYFYINIYVCRAESPCSSLFR